LNRNAILNRGLCKKSQSFLFSFLAGATKLYFEQTSFFLISLREIRKKDVCSKLSFAAEGGGMLFAQPLPKQAFSFS